MCAAMTIFAGAVGWLEKTSRNQAGFSGDVSPKPRGRGPVAAPPGPPVAGKPGLNPHKKTSTGGLHHPAAPGFGPGTALRPFAGVRVDGRTGEQACPRHIAAPGLKG